MVRNMFKDNNKKPEQLKWRRSNVFVVNFENISHLFLVFVLLTFEKKMLAGLLQFSDTFFYNLLYFLPSTRPLTVFIKNSILEVQLDCEYTSNIRSQNFDSRPNSDHNSRTKMMLAWNFDQKLYIKQELSQCQKRLTVTSFDIIFDSRDFEHSGGRIPVEYSLFFCISRNFLSKTAYKSQKSYGTYLPLLWSYQLDLANICYFYWKKMLQWAKPSHN